MNAPAETFTVPPRPTSDVLGPVPRQIHNRSSPHSIGEFLRVSHALILRETQTRFGRENIGFAWILVEPAAFVLGIVFLWVLIRGDHDKNLPIVPFLLTGYVPLLMYRHCAGRALRCMQANADFLFHRPVSILAIYCARLYVEVFSFLGAFCVLWIAFGFFGSMGLPERWGMFFTGWGIYILFSVGVGIFVGTLSERSELVDRIWQPISYVTIPISGTFFMVDWLPDYTHSIAVLFPPVTAVELIRGGFFGASVPIHTNIPVAIISGTIFLCLGLWLMRSVRDYVEIN